MILINRYPFISHANNIDGWINMNSEWMELFYSLYFYTHKFEAIASKGHGYEVRCTCDTEKSYLTWVTWTGKLTFFLKDPVANH